MSVSKSIIEWILEPLEGMEEFEYEYNQALRASCKHPSEAMNESECEDCGKDFS